MKPTRQQDAIGHRASELRAGNILKVIALAGTGKTTTLKLCATRRNDRGIYLAFNSAIAAEARVKLGSTRCNAQTMHSLAFGVMRDRMEGGPIKMNARTLLDTGLIAQHPFPNVKGWAGFRIAAAVVRTMSAYAASADQEFSIEHGITAMIDSVGDPDFMNNLSRAKKARDEIQALAPYVTTMAQKYWETSKKAGVFSHDMYLKELDLNGAALEEAFARYRYVMVDEAQDINPVQRSILLKTGLPLIAVGDAHQQIYSWRGAENALEHFVGDELYLSQSFRFGEDIATIGRLVLNRKPGIYMPEPLTGIGPRTLEGYAGPRGAVISRTNIGSLDKGLEYLDKGYRVHVDNMEGLLEDVRSARALYEGNSAEVKSREIKQFEDWDELCMAAEDGMDPALMRIVNLIKNDRDPDVERMAQNQASANGTAQIACYTAHRSKGLEFPAVILGDDWPTMNQLGKRYELATEKSDKHVTQALEAYNTLYVAVTRSILRCSGYTELFKEPEPRDDLAPVGRRQVNEMLDSMRRDSVATPTGPVEDYTFN